MRESLERFLVGEFVIDLSGQSLTRLGVAVPLRRKAFQVLSVLLMNRSRVVTKAELLDQIWGIAVTEDVLTGCVREIRRALGDGPQNSSMIRTVHGEGYQFVGPVRVISGAEQILAPPVGPGRRVRRPARLASIGVFILALAGWTWWSSQSIALPGGRPPREVAWWRFDEPSGQEVMDSSGGGNRGRIQNGVRRVPGILGSALEFDGRTGFVLGEGFGNGFPLGDSARTVACWVKPSGADTGDRNILQWGTSVIDPPRSTFHLLLEGGYPAWGNGYEHGGLCIGHRLVDGGWHHIAAEYTGSPGHSATLFVDGQILGETNKPMLADTRLGMPWRMGVFMLGGTPYEGLLDDLRLFRSALTPTWIQALYNCGESRNRFRSSMGGAGFFVPTGDAELTPGTDGFLENRKEGFGGAQLAFSDGVCEMKALRGAAMPDAYRLSMEVELPNSGPAVVLSAGPTVLAERAGPGVVPQRGYWIALSNNGTVAVRPVGDREKTLAEWRDPSGFDAGRAYTLSVAVRGQSLAVDLNGSTVITLRTAETGGRAAGVAFAAGGTPLHTLPQRVRAVRLKVD